MKRLFCIVVTVFSVVVCSGPALSHPLGMRAFGHRILLHLYKDHIELNYVVEVPTYQLLIEIDRYRSERGIEDFDKAASNAFDQEMLSRIKRALTLTINSERHGWISRPMGEGQVGKGDVNFFEYRLKLFAYLPDTKDGSRFDVKIVDDNFRRFDGAFLDGLVAEEGVKIEGTNIPKESPGWSMNNAYREISAIALLDSGWDKTTYFGAAEKQIAKKKVGEGSYLSRLIHEKDLSISFVAVALLTAFALGAAHALTPGHGKALVGAYLVGSKGDYLHAVVLGIIVTVSHTAVVFLFGLFFLIFGERFLPEQATPYIGLASGIMIVVIGVVMFFRWRRGRSGDDIHEHEHAHEVKGAIGLKSLLALGISGGMVPCPSALALMLIAMSIDRVAWGMVLVSAFSLGLASVLALLGILAVGAADLFDRFRSGRRLIRVAPLVSAVIITVVGIVIVFSSALVM